MLLCPGHCRQCRRLAEELPGRRLVLLGESMGGLLALLAAARTADVVDRVILVNPASRLGLPASSMVWG